jgi:hypothetical protein
MKKTETIIVTNVTKVKRILNLYFTTKFKKQNEKLQSKENPKEMNLLLKMKMKMILKM